MLVVIQQYFHFINEEAKHREVKRLTKKTQLVCDRAGVETQTWLLTTFMA